MCGNIIMGRTDAARAFLTENGSFWSNCTTKLAVTTTDEDRQARTRNRSNREGYESVALIPLRNAEEVMGVLQLNDRRTDRFSLDMIHFMEEIGAGIGIAITRSRMKEAMLESMALLKTERAQLLSIFDSINEVIIVIDPRTYEILYANKFAEDLFGKKLMGGSCYERFAGNNSPCGTCPIETVMELQGEPCQWEYHNAMVNKDFLATDRMIRWPDGRDVKFQIGTDVTERKRAERERETAVPTSPGPEDGVHRDIRRRDRPRFQQPAVRDHGQRRIGNAEHFRPRGNIRGPEGDFRGHNPVEKACGADPRVQPSCGAGEDGSVPSVPCEGDGKVPAVQPPCNH